MKIYFVDTSDPETAGLLVSCHTYYRRGSLSLTGDEEFDEVEFEAAKSSLVFEIIDEEKTVSGAAEQSILYYFRGLPNTHRFPKHSERHLSISRH